MPDSILSIKPASDRDLRQRSLGCIGFSVVTHATLLLALAFVPKMTANADDNQLFKIGKISDPTIMELQSSTSSSNIEIKPIVVEPQPIKAEEVMPTDVVVAPVEPVKPVVPKKIVKPKAIAKVKTPVVVPTAPSLPEKVEKPIEELDPKLSDENSDVELARDTQTPVAATIAAPAMAADPALAAATDAAAAEAAIPAQPAQPAQPSQPEQPAMPAMEAPAAAAAATTGAANGAPAGAKIRDAADLVPRAGNLSPKYPQIDRISGQQGLAVVVGKVSADGTMASVYVEKSSGSKTLDQEALSTFKSWKFMPGQEGYVRKPFKFALSGEARELHAHLGN